MKILIVDDEFVSRMKLEKIIENLDGQVCAGTSEQGKQAAENEVCLAVNGSEALQIIMSESPPDLILLDVMMPEMDGYEVCSRIKADEQTRNIPVIFISGRDEDIDEIKGFEAGAVDYITKPFNPVIVKVRVRTQLELVQHRVNLEKLVKERTAELEMAYKNLADANQIKNRFLGNMSHELRTPMNGIVGITCLLLESGLEEKHQDLLEMLYRAADSQMTVIDDILNFSSMESDQVYLKQINFDLNNIVTGVIDMFKILANDKKLNLEHSIHQDVPLKLKGDPGRIRQVFINLLGNALKFTQEGRVDLNITMIEAKGRAVDLFFEVKDTGIGIKEEKINSLFKPFFQLDESSTRRYGGTGLGLTNSKRLIEMMGGGLTVESKEGKGSVFSFTLCLEMQS
jgi:signal transduction histidine kinase